jgi:hypothetical protein
MPDGLESFLEARLTVTNAILGIAFLLIWHFSFRLVGVYDATATPPLRKQARRLLTASSIATFQRKIRFGINRSHHRAVWKRQKCPAVVPAGHSND